MDKKKQTVEEYVKTTKQYGDEGEQDVVEKVSCPNCSRSLMLLPTNYPLCDVQCTGCHFRAQIKTNNTKPKNIIFGATWDIVDKVLKSGYLLPPLIANFHWKEGDEHKQEIRFYPFISKKSLKKRETNIKSTGRRLMMFNYNLKDLPYISLYSK